MLENENPLLLYEENKNNDDDTLYKECDLLNVDKKKIGKGRFHLKPAYCIWCIIDLLIILIFDVVILSTSAAYIYNTQWAFWTANVIALFLNFLIFGIGFGAGSYEDKSRSVPDNAQIAVHIGIMITSTVIIFVGLIIMANIG